MGSGLCFNLMLQHTNDKLQRSVKGPLRLHTIVDVITSNTQSRGTKKRGRHRQMIRASPRTVVFWVSWLKKRKRRQKISIQQKLYLPRLLFSFSIQRVPLDIFA